MAILLSGVFCFGENEDFSGFCFVVYSSNTSWSIHLMKKRIITTLIIALGVLGSAAFLFLYEKEEGWGILERFQSREEGGEVDLSSEKWQQEKYVSGEEIMGFSLDIPDGWKAQEKEEIVRYFDEDRSAIAVIRIDLIPPEGFPSGRDYWGGFSLTVYPYKGNMEEWIGKYFSSLEDEVTFREEGELGGRPMFSLSSSEFDEFPHPPGLIVLGNQYSYEYSVHQNMETDFAKRMKEEILPNISIR